MTKNLYIPYHQYNHLITVLHQFGQLHLNPKPVTKTICINLTCPETIKPDLL
jgi:hypothetical protein